MKNIAYTYYKPKVGCGGNETNVYKDELNVYFKKVGFRVNRLYAMPIKKAEIAIKIMIDAVEVLEEIKGNDWHFFYYGELCTKRESFKDAKEYYIKNIYLALDSILYEYFLRGAKDYYSDVFIDCLKSVKKSAN